MEQYEAAIRLMANRFHSSEELEKWTEEYSLLKSPYVRERLIDLKWRELEAILHLEIADQEIHDLSEGCLQDGDFDSIPSKKTKRSSENSNDCHVSSFAWLTQM